jgi:beta-lysine N6-acetyltransferase
MNVLTEGIMIRTFKSIITHDKGNDRVYLMKLHENDFPEIISHIDELARENGYTKIFAKIPTDLAPLFITSGYITEAYIPYFFKGSKDVFFMCKYLSEERNVIEADAMWSFQEVLVQSFHSVSVNLVKDYQIRSLDGNNISSMVHVFSQVFKTYPFPVFEPSFLQKSMHTGGTRYFGIFHQSKLIAVSSAECDIADKNAELTDFAVLPEHRGRNLAAHMLGFMEDLLKKDGFSTLYTICRLKSIPVNKTFCNSGYKYSGTLVRNTQISGEIESMNVWYKNLR